MTRSVAHVTEEERRYLARYVVPSLQQGLAVMYRCTVDTSEHAQLVSTHSFDKYSVQDPAREAPALACRLAQEK